jgi:hypothetical protein
MISKVATVFRYRKEHELAFTHCLALTRQDYAEQQIHGRGYPNRVIVPHRAAGVHEKHPNDDN